MFISRSTQTGLLVALGLSSVMVLAAQPASRPASAARPATAPAEEVYRGELVSFPGPWGFQVGKSGIILVSDEQLEDLANPDKPVNLSLGPTPHEQSLRQICEQAKAAGHRTLIVAFDQFFAQYRPGQNKPRRLMPDKADYVQLIASISRFIQPYGLGLELSLLTPLEIGPGYTAETGEHGVWMEYRKALRDPESGDYSVQLWRQTKWANNKGAVKIEDAGVKVFAFRERRLHGTPYLVVDPAGIVDITSTAQVEVWSGMKPQNNPAVRIRVHGTGAVNAAGLDRVLVVQVYNTPEMDYFSEHAAPYLRKLLDRYIDAGVKLNALYSDEMHIQQDWGYHNHHEHGQFAMRYVSPGLARRFSSLYGGQYGDFAKYLIYFTYGQEDFASDLSANERLMHVFGAKPEEIRATAQFRSRYYRLLQDGVVDLFTDAKKYAEGRIGHRLEARAHATWAESPTCDVWGPGQSRYEYTPGFVWSNTVQQAAAACHDYFKWGDFLTGNGNDHAEGGWIDRNYYALALAASTGILNDVPYSYAAIWGAPGEVIQRRRAVIDASGAAASTPCAMVEGMEHRDVQVLRLYPLDLVAVEERFGSWMSQEGYANYVTQAKLLERGKVHGGAIEMAGRRFTTLIAEFEPFPSRSLLEMMRQLAEQGGRAIWSGPPPMLGADGQPILSQWQEVFGVDYNPGPGEGIVAAGKQVMFDGNLAGIPPMTILTDFLVDHIYPITPRSGARPASSQAASDSTGGTQVVARCANRIVGTCRVLSGGGSLTVLGFRPRDDQSASLGYEERHWFDILSKLGAYPATGRFPEVNDNTEFLSRTTGYLLCRFPNGAIALAPHLKDLEEAWPGGFARDPKQDEAAVKQLKLPSQQISLKEFKVNGHEVTYEGQELLAIRIGDDGTPVAFYGANTREVRIDGRVTKFAEQPLALISYAPVDVARRVRGGAVLQILVRGAGEVHIPIPGLQGSAELILEGRQLGSRGSVVPSRIENEMLTFTAGPGTANWLYVVPK